MIVITGGAGFIGSNLVAGLEESGEKNLVICDKFGSDDKWRNVAKRELRDIVQPENLLRYLDLHAGEVQAIFHMGAISSTTETNADLIVRGKHCHDNAVPAGNGTLLGVFARLWILTGDSAWHDRALRQFGAFAGELESNFFPLMTLLNGYETLHSPIELVIVGDPAAPATEALRRAAYNFCLPNKIVRRLAPDALLPADHPAAGKGLVDGKPALYVCRNLSCEAPVTEPTQLRAVL